MRTTVYLKPNNRLMTLGTAMAFTMVAVTGSMLAMPMAMTTAMPVEEKMPLITFLRIFMMKAIIMAKRMASKVVIVQATATAIPTATVMRRTRQMESTKLGAIFWMNMKQPEAGLTIDNAACRLRPVTACRRCLGASACKRLGTACAYSLPLLQCICKDMVVCICRQTSDYFGKEAYFYGKTI